MTPLTGTKQRMNHTRVTAETVYKLNQIKLFKWTQHSLFLIFAVESTKSL